MSDASLIANILKHKPLNNPTDFLQSLSSKKGGVKKNILCVSILLAECLFSHLRAIAPNGTWSRFISIHNKAINWRIAIMVLYFCRIKPYAYHFISHYSY